MTTEKAMKALLEGMTLRKDGVVITPAEWGLLMKFDDGTCSKIVLEDCEVVNEYPFDFEQAVRAMLDGRIMTCDANDWYAYRFRNGVFESSRDWDYYPMWERCSIYIPLQEAKWKVVE